jgi:transposase
MNSGPRRNRSWRGATHGRVGSGGIISAGRVAGANRSYRGRSLPPSFMFCAQVASGRRCRRVLVVAVPSMHTSSGGVATDSSCGYGGRAWRNTTRWQGLPGRGRVSMAPWAKRPSPKKPSDPIRRTGGKKGTKRSLLVDGAGAPLSLIVSGANRHDVKLLDATLDGIVVSRPRPTARQPQHLCADKAYQGQPAQASMLQRGYTPHVRQICDEAKAKRGRQPARRWVVERSHSWFNRFRKLLVRYEKKEANYLALAHCAAAIICFRMA